MFIVTPNPLPDGTVLVLRFVPPGRADPIEVAAEVIWVNPGGDGQESGMGVSFVNPDDEVRRRIRELIRTVAFIE